jgi:hypothetical protein
MAAVLAIFIVALAGTAYIRSFAREVDSKYGYDVNCDELHQYSPL